MAKIEVKALKVWFPVKQGFIQSLFRRKEEYIKAVDDVSFSINEGEIFCLAGESGCGKTTTGKSIIRLVEPTSGKIIYSNVNLLNLSKDQLRSYRKKFQIVLQDPFGSLNPRQKIKDIVGEPLKVHGLVHDRKTRTQKVKDALSNAGLNPPDKFKERYPHELSGGERQRVVIASALALSPDFIVADEPVSMLDVSVRAEILKLLLHLKDKEGLTYLFITHDLSLAWMISDRIAIMYLGKIMEIGPSDDVIQRPLNPYTKALVSVIPIPDPVAKRRKKVILEGDPPDPINIPSGCRFRPRCSQVQEICSLEEPLLHEVYKNHWTACHMVNPPT
jgi:oligopeptide/dipeptide ABC transporter ATP-binding protein